MVKMVQTKKNYAENTTVCVSADFGPPGRPFGHAWRPLNPNLKKFIMHENLFAGCAPDPWRRMFQASKTTYLGT